MKEELQEQLWDEFPLLFKQGFYFECGNGWFEIIKELCQKLYPLIKDGQFEEFCVPNVSQVKEKYGGLRFYMSNSTDEIEKLIEKAADISKKICEMCGKPGVLKKHKFWYSTLCEEHRN